MAGDLQHQERHVVAETRQTETRQAATGQRQDSHGLGAIGTGIRPTVYFCLALLALAGLITGLTLAGGA